MFRKKSLILCWFVLFCSISSVWAATETVNYTYDLGGQVIRTEYNGSMVVDYTYDGIGNRLARTISTTGAPANASPSVPSPSSPANGATGVSTTSTVLSWNGSDPDSGDIVAYDVYFGVDPSPRLLMKGTTETSTALGQTLFPMTTYYWKIVARDNHNAVSESPVWSFTTANHAPTPPEIVLPFDNALVDYTNASLQWTASDPDFGDTLTYDVYFGENPTPPIVQSDTSAQTFTTGSLSQSTTYYWQIVARDSSGTTTAGPVWSFHTSDQSMTVLSTDVTTDTILTAADGPYIVTDTIQVAAGATLTIEPGTIIKVQQEHSISVFGRLNAVGTEADPIIITSLRDDAHGGDTNGDGTNTYPEPGDWSYLRLNNTSVNHSIVYTHILYSGALNSTAVSLGFAYYRYFGQGALWIEGGTPTIEHCTIANSGTFGIYLKTGAAVLSNNTFSDNSDYDIYAAYGFNGTISGNTISNGMAFAGQGSIEISGNEIFQNNYYPFRVAADNVGQLFAANIWHNVDELSYLEITGGTIGRDATWPALMPYHIITYITVSGTDGADGVTTLTIAPGAQLRFDDNASLIVSSGGYPGALSAVGTTADPIVFTSNTSPPDVRKWDGISLYSYTDDATILEHCIIEYAGRNGRAIFVYNSSPTIKYCTIRHSLGHGIMAQNTQNFSPIIKNNTMVHNSDFDIHLTGMTDAIVTGNTINSGVYVESGTVADLTGNTINWDDAHPLRVVTDSVGEFFASNTINNITSDSYIEVAYGTVSRDATWPAVMPYHIVGSLAVSGTDGADGLTTLTITPGAQLRFNQNTNLAVGSGNYPGALSAVGTIADPIVFTSNVNPPAAGNWAGLFLYGGTDDATVLEHCIIEYAGSSVNGQAVYMQNSSPTIKYCTIRYSQGYGIKGSHAQNFSPTIKNNTLEDNGNYDIHLTSVTDAVVTGNTTNSGVCVESGTVADLSGNTINWDDAHPLRVVADSVEEFFASNTINNITSDSYIEVTYSTVSRDATWPAVMPYHIVGNVTVQGADGADGVTALTIAPGAQLRFNRYTSLTVGQSNGQPGALSAVGTITDPIVFTSNVDPPATSNWAGFIFNSGTVDAATILEHCTIEYAGNGAGGRAVYLQNSSPVIKYCTIRHSQGKGIDSSSGSPEISNNLISHCGSYGIYSYSGTPVIEGNTLVDNSNYDIYLFYVTDAVVTGNAINNGIYVKSSTVAALSGNTINWDDAHQMRVHADSVGELFASNTINNVTGDSYLEVTSGTVSRDATWPAAMPYHIVGNIMVQGADGADGITTLTIDPGAQLRFNRYTSLTVGQTTGQPGALSAVGTITDPIVFTSNVDPPAAGNWYGITFNPTTDDGTTILEHCTIEYAGSNTTGRAVYVQTSSPVINYCTIRHSQGKGVDVRYGSPEISNNHISHCGSYGIYSYSGTPVIEGNTLVDNSNYDIYLTFVADAVVTGNTTNNGIYVDNGAEVVISGNTINWDDAHQMRVHADSVGELFASNTINNVTGDSYLEVTSGTVSRDATWPAAMPYHIVGNITVQGADGADGVTALTIAPGAQLRFNRYTSLTVGQSNGQPGALSAVGTITDPIVFTSNVDPPAAGNWYGITFNPTTDDDTTILEHCTIEYAGSGTNGRAVYVSNSSPVINYSTVRHSQGSGVDVNFGAPEISNNTISDTDKGVYVRDGMPVIYANRFSGNSSYGLYYTRTTPLVAQYNWWGDASGPYNASTNPSGLGDAVSDNVDFDPWVIDPNDMDMDGVPDN